MKYNVRNRLENRLGAPSRHTKKLLAWHIRPGFSVALQLDQPADEMQSGSDSYALLWLPTECAHRLPCNLEQRPGAGGKDCVGPCLVSFYCARHCFCEYSIAGYSWACETLI